MQGIKEEEMGRILFYGAVSLDGYLATKEDSLQWSSILQQVSVRRMKLL